MSEPSSNRNYVAVAAIVTAGAVTVVGILSGLDGVALTAFFTFLGGMAVGKWFTS